MGTLLGNLVFQAVKSMVTGLGFEGEDPKLLFTRTFVFAFLLLFSQQVCEIGLGISSQIISLLQIPSSVTVTIPEESNFNIGASWLLVIIVGFVIMWQFVKLFFEIAERYVVTAMLVLLAPLAFGMGGSKNTEDIFRGWARMFGSMCLMMILNVVFLKLLISAMGYIPSGCCIALDAAHRRDCQSCPKGRRHCRTHRSEPRHHRRRARSWLTWHDGLCSHQRAGDKRG